MKRPTRITLTLLGIAASVGLGSQISQVGHRIKLKKPTEKRWISTKCSMTFEPIALENGWIRFQCEGCGELYDTAPFGEPSEEAVKHMQHMTPSPTPTKPLQEGYRRVKCAKCGQEYDAPLCGCIPTPLTKEQEKHLHLKPDLANVQK